MLRQEGLQVFSALMSQVMRLAFQDFYGSEALRALLQELD